MAGHKPKYMQSVLVVLGMGDEPSSASPYANVSEEDIKASRNYDKTNTGVIDSSFEKRQADKVLFGAISQVSQLFENMPNLQKSFSERQRTAKDSLANDLNDLSAKLADANTPTLYVSKAEDLDTLSNMHHDADGKGFQFEVLVAGAYAGQQVRDLTNSLIENGISARVVSDMIIDEIPSRDEEGPGHHEANALSFITNDHVDRLLAKELDEEQMKLASTFIHDYNARDDVKYKSGPGDDGWYEKRDIIDTIESIEDRARKGVCVFSDDLLNEISRRPKPTAEIISLHNNNTATFD
ncbi:MAG: hypothetical protein ACRBDI_07705 [Alphaproteobacteria bacterium]